MRFFIYTAIICAVAACGGGSSSSGSGDTPDAETPDTQVTVWQPEPGTTWQIQLSGTLNTSYDADVYDVDLFDTSAETIAALQDRGIRVICYFSAGSYEDWRDDAGQFPDAVLGNDMEGWPGEKWLDIRDTGSLMPLMEARMDIAAAKGCDAVDPDNVDGYANDTGFALTAGDQLDYNIMLAEAAHERGLAAGLKNDLDQIEELVDYFEFTVNEQCFYYDECDMLAPFIDAGKAVFSIEYDLSADDFCAESVSLNFSSLLMDYALDGGRHSCM